ncbi:MAG: DUF4340 domain-containing protein [Deltaproteobacteria bacterium]|nr:DUF4340 domain-containing protein [Deltaproteobacteria bacterium]MBW1873852.1 DUF4340 domain-containing protein [Deltaproteobacteria bacterium]MBW2209733.1 DUF4340 domain-containing protein [Deltaproteobacteria bacterium]MBW2213612.1 DUF4340 domain-containing protein [Deltaproteobacteria bacterium]MBW2378062.1 DUF4340 domain-containing protein [Deltaproteobacteria bacterium]
MSARTPIILLVVAAILLAYVLLFERGRPGRTEIDSRSGLLLEALVRERITRVRIASGEERIALLRQGEGFDETWTLEEPKQAPANLEAIENYLRNWEFAIPVRTLQSPSAEDVRNFGIDTPKAEVTFEMGRAKVRVSLGSGSPVDGGGYIRIDDRREITVVNDDVVALFARTADAFELKGDAGAPDLSELIDAQEDAAVAAP